MKTLLTSNLSTKTAQAGGNDWVPPTYTFGEAFTLALRFQEDVAGQTIEPTLDIRGLYAAIGSIDARPDSGDWALQIGPGARTSANTTDAIAHDCSAVQLAAAINAKTAVVAAYGQAKVQKEDGSWRVIFGTGAVQVALKVVANRLRPMSVGRTMAVQIDGAWWHEVRLVQSPVAFTDSGERILPSPPTVTRARAGGSEGGFAWNEIQSLYVPPDYRATYVLKIGSARTTELSVSDNAETILAALEGAAGKNFKVTNPKEFTANIEFINDLAGSSYDLIEVIPLNPPEGDLTFTLTLDRAELHARLRSEAEITEQLEVRIRVAEASGEIRERVAIRQDLTIQRPLLFPELATIPSVNWLRPLSPKNYSPFVQTNVITGQQFYPEVVGDGEATEFPVAHGLDTDVVFVWVRENSSGGRQLVDGTDYSVTIDNADSVTVTALGDEPPAMNAWLVTVVSAQTVGAFANDLSVSIAQVVGLQDLLDEMTDRIANIEDRLPFTSPGVRASEGGQQIIPIRDFYEIFPGKFAADTDFKQPKSPRRLGGLLPAIHDAVPEALPVPMPAASGSAATYESLTVTTADVTAGASIIPCDALAGGSIAAGGKVRILGTLYTVETIAVSGTQFTISPAAAEDIESGTEVEKQILTPYAGNVYLNATGAAVLVPGGLGRRGSWLAPAEAAASDGRVWYPVTRDGTTNSYYPEDFERELFIVPINDRMLRPGGNVSLEFSLAMQLLGANTRMQAVLVIDSGEVPQQSTPAPVGVNLSDVTWSATPLLAQRVILSEVAVKGRFGVAVRRSISNTLSADRLLYNVWEAAGTQPASANFVLRARLVQWDTENSVANARGAVWIGMSDAEATITNS